MSEFNGFQEGDFGQIAGTTWRGKQNEDSLARILVERMQREGSSPDYDSWAMGRFSGLHIAAKEFFSYTDSWRLAKLNVWLREEEASFGFWVEKIPPDPGGPEHWQHLLEHLESGDDAGEILMTAMRQHHLHLWIGHSDTRWAVVGEELGLLPTLHKRISWPEMLDELRGVPDGTWSCLFAARYIPKTEAIALGRGIAEIIGDVFLELEPVYLVTVS